MRRLVPLIVLVGVAGVAAGVSIGMKTANPSSESRRSLAARDPSEPAPEERRRLSTSGYSLVMSYVPRWDPSASLQEIRATYDGAGYRGIRMVDLSLRDPRLSSEDRIEVLISKAALYNYEGQPQKAYEVLCEARSACENSRGLTRKYLYTLIYLQGVSSLRRGENENCIMCRGESSCILPISDAARHINPEGSQQAIIHFTEYLAEFPRDREVHWLLNLAHMTLGEFPDKVDPQSLVPMDQFVNSEFDIGRFRDVGHRVGVNQLTEAGGAIMDDFNNDGLLDFVISSFDPGEKLRLLKNRGTGTFEEQSDAAGFADQLGGLNCMQTDYNNDGNLDVFVVRGAWLDCPIRPSLLRNDGNGRFSDVTESAGLLAPANSIAAQWADYDNDGWLDLFVCCERQASRLYHNERNGTFRETSFDAGILLGSTCIKGANWFDYDNDGYPDLFLNIMTEFGTAVLYHNERNGTFRDVSDAMGIDGPKEGFSCWAWDYNNDGWLDIFSTCYQRSLDDVVRGLNGTPHSLESNRLFRNDGGQKFTDVTREAGLDTVFATMGSNFADFDNDGFLDMYLGTGDPDYATLVPNRMFRNVDGRRFAEITSSAGTGNLQKGHGVACGDWDRDGNVDLFIEMGGAVPGDRYHNILFQNPGHSNSWLTVKLIGEKTNRAAIGARIKVVTAGPESRTIYRHVSSGSSFGANPLQQTIGLGTAKRVESLEITWPTSGTSQTFRDLAVNQAVEIKEFAEQYRTLEWTPIPLPPEK